MWIFYKKSPLPPWSGLIDLWERVRVRGNEDEE